jgi:outer membrane protein insertion porin family
VSACDGRAARSRGSNGQYASGRHDGRTALTGKRAAAGLLPVFASVLLMAAPCELRAQAPTTAPSVAPAKAVSPYDGLMIRELGIAGLKRIEESYVRNQVRTRVGQPYSQDQVQRDVGRLLRTGRFFNVTAEPKLVDGQVNLTFILSEKPEVAAIEFNGAVKFKRKDLLAALTFGVGDPLDPYEVRQGQEAIQRLYREKGYAYADVAIDAAALEKENRVVYNITENQRVRVRKIVFEGNTAFGARELRGQIATNTWLPILRTGDFDPDRAQRDASTLQSYYRDRGFLDAEVSYVTEYQDVARTRLTLIFRISEGTHYKIRSIGFEGNTVYTADDLLSTMQLKPGDYFNQVKLRTDVTALETKYGSNGYIEARVTSSWVFATEPGEVVVTLKVDEEGQFHLGWIEVNGNFHTKEKVVRRELRFYPEDIYDVTKTRAAEKRLKDTGLFSEAKIEPAGTEPSVRDAIVNLTENEKTTNFIAGVGASSDNGLVGNIELSNTNFDITDRPRTWEEFFRGRAFRGAGQTMRIQFEPGTEFTRFRVDFREPYLMDMPIGFGTSFFLFERQRDGYDERRVGGNVSFDHKFESGLLKTWTGEIALRTEYVDVADRESFAAKDIRDVSGGNYLSTVKLSLLHDTTDSRFNPGMGHRFQMSYEQAGVLGGPFYYGKAEASGTQYWTVAIDEQERRSVFSLRGNVGQVIGDAPVFERYYAGGIGSFRGFNFRGISPRQGLRHNRVGGDFELLGGGEYTFPLYAKMVRGVLFSDMGTVEKDFGLNSWRMSVGAGVRLTLDIFGPVPMEFDVGIPVAKDSEDNTRIFSFFVGLPVF